VLNQLKIAFIGTGNMAAAIIRGLAKGEEKPEMFLYNRTAAKAATLAAETGSVFCDTLAECLAPANVVLLAVKPQQMAEVLENIKPHIGEGERKLFITVAAGVELVKYEEALPGQAIVRAMPNTSAAVLESMTALMAGAWLSDEEKAAADAIFAAVGKTVWIPESQIHAFIAISGSAVAYYYYFTEALAAAGESLGISAEDAAAITRQVAVGAGKMLAEREESPTQLRINVTSPGGTTAKALEVLQVELPTTVRQACRACADRSAEMAKQ